MKITDDVIKVLKAGKKFAVVIHINPDGDAIGSQLAFVLALKKMGKEAIAYMQKPIPDNYRFLPGSESIKVVDSLPESFDTLICLDIPELDRLGKFEESVKGFKRIINIDHHICNAKYGIVNISEISASATAELVYHIIKMLDIEMDAKMAVCLYSGIVTDTGSFQYRNTTAEAHRVVANLIENGVRAEEVTEEIYEAKTLSQVKLLGLALETMSFSSDGQISWLWITKKMKDLIGGQPNDTEGFVNYARSVKDVKVAVFFEELDGLNIKISLRSKISRVDVNKIAHKFGGGGHPAAAGAVVSGTPEKVEEMILKIIKIEFKNEKK